MGGDASNMGFNIYDDVPTQDLSYNQDPRSNEAIAETIFNQHAQGDIMNVPGWYAACHSLTRAFPKLVALVDPAMVGRGFELFDLNGDGILDLDEFVGGVRELLEPTSVRAKSLAKRLYAGRIHEGQQNFSHVKTVAIIGAGVAGLQTARALSKVGLTVTIYESRANVGGVWRENYIDFGLQVPKELYEFPDYPRDQAFKLSAKATAEFPKGEGVQEYIESYADEFGLREMCEFNTAVQELRVEENGDHQAWTVVYDHRDSYMRASVKKEERTFDFVVVATGMYGWPPHMPLAIGSEKFKGEILHSCTFTDPKCAAGKKVVTVGGGKSAVDNAVAAAKYGTESTLLFRTAHWPVPRNLLNLVPFKWGTYSRFGHFMLPAHYDGSCIKRWFHDALRPVKWVWWRIVETMFRVQFGLSGDLLPTVPIEHDVFNGGQILSYEFRDMLKQNKLSAFKGSISCFTEDGVILGNDKEIKCDMVVYGTGFKKSYHMFDPIVQRKLHLEKDGLYLYRNIMPPNVANLAFIGSEVSTFNNILTQGLQAQWLQRVLCGQIFLPSPGHMSRDLERDQAWKRSWMPPTNARASIWQLHMMQYHDTLCKDMGTDHRRKGLNPLAEVFVPYAATDYAQIFHGTETKTASHVFMIVDGLLLTLLFLIYYYLF